MVDDPENLQAGPIPFSSYLNDSDEPGEPAGLPDSGERSEFVTGAVRDAMNGKGFFSSIPPCALRAIARRFEDGAKKYGPCNWMRGTPLSRFYDAIFRHSMQAAEGDKSEDHFGAILWNAAGWLWTEEQIKAGKLLAELDDLPFRERGEC